MDHGAIKALLARSTGDMPQEAVRDIFREIFAACLPLELPTRVAFVGHEGDPGHEAARGRFGGGSALAAVDSIPAALEEVARKRAAFAVVPFETRAEGLLKSAVVALASSDLRVVEVLDVRFDLHVMNRTGAFGDVEKIYATAVDRASCERNLSAFSPSPVVSDAKTPALACQLAAEEAGAAAIASEAFGGHFGLEVARRNVRDGGSERARYAVVGARPSGRTGADVTSLVFSVQDAPGSLLDVLKAFAERGINLTNIQSHPAQGESWSYLFYVEMGGHFTDRPLVTAFEEMKRITRFFKVLGSYPAP
jgi:chorismate mutase/prephenate dehydratase